MYPPEKPSAPALSGYPNPPPPGPVGYYPPMEKPMTQPPPPPPNVNYPNPPPPGPSGYPPPQGPQGGYPPPPFGQQAPMVQGIPVGGIPMNNPSPIGIQTPQPQAQQTGYWSTGLCDCFSDIPSCLLACFCPCVAFGRVSEIVDKGTSSCGFNGAMYGLLCSLGGAAVVFGVPLSCAWIYSCTYRGKLKQDMNMPPSCCEDCCIHFCCEPCALAQEYRELQNRGYDLSLGWNGNVEKQKQQQAGNGMPAMVAAPAAPSMAR